MIGEREVASCYLSPQVGRLDARSAASDLHLPRGANFLATAFGGRRTPSHLDLPL
jgi:hypothetical protein